MSTDPIVSQEADPAQGKFLNSAHLSAAIRSTEKPHWWVSYRKSIGDFWDGKCYAQRDKRVYRSEGR